MDTTADDGRAACVALADEIQRAAAAGHIIASPPSSRPGAFGLDAGYAVERELARRRYTDGRRRVGRKVGYANRALWRVIKLDTLVWADVYDDTVTFAAGNEATMSFRPPMAAAPPFRFRAPRIEPEIVFKLKDPLEPGTTDPQQVLAAVEWLGLGFELIECVWADWKYQPADFVAAYGLHAALIVGAPHLVTPDTQDALAEALPTFGVTLACDGAVVATGSGRNSLRSPALCLAELATATSQRVGAEPLAAGEIVSSGSLTDSLPVLAGHTWTASVDGLDLPPLTVRFTA